MVVRASKLSALVEMLGRKWVKSELGIRSIYYFTLRAVSKAIRASKVRAFQHCVLRAWLRNSKLGLSPTQGSYDNPPESTSHLSRHPDLAHRSRFGYLASAAKG
jgi:hypothetical protein